MESTSAQSTLESVLGYIREELRARSGRFLDRAERTLAQQWTQVQDLGERNVMQEAARWLTTNKPAIHARLYRQLIEALNSKPVSPADQPNLRVLETCELAIALARDQMISKVMTEARAELAALEARFELLARSGAYANPKALWPGALADNFVNALKSLNVPDRIQRMLIDTYGDEGIRLLLEFYRGINALLIRNNVGRGITDPFATADRSIEPLRAGDRSVFALARTVRLVLGRLQKRMAEMDLKTWTPGTLRDLIEHQLVESAGGQSRSVLSRAQSQSIDHVEGLLLDWLRDDRISARVREEIRRLSLPILVGRLICGDEFAAPDNPIRVFLRQLAVIGYRDQEFPLSTYDSVRLLVDRIVAEQGGESASFRSAADALNTLSRHEVRRRLTAHAHERPSKPASETYAAFAREAHRQVTAELTEHAAGLVLPEEIKRFVLHLLGPWMMVRYQRYGQDSVPWRQAREFAASFFEGLRPAVSAYDAERKRAHRARILHQARVRAERSNTPPDQVKALLAALERYITNLDHVDASAEALEAPRARAIDNFLDGLQPIAAA